MTDIAEASVRLRPNLSTFRAETETGVKSALSGVARTAALALGGVTVVGTIKKVAEAAAAQQKELAAVRRAVEATGAAWKVYGTTVEGVLKRQSQASGFTVEELAQAFVRVETATKNTTESLKILNAAQDVARARNTSVAQAALVLTRATLGSTASLRRFGIVIPQVTAAQDKLKANHVALVEAGAKFTRAQEAQYKSSLAQAKVLDAQASKTNVLAEVQKRFGGQSATFARTAAGQFARFQRAVTELEVSIGKQLLPTLTSAVETLRNWVTQLEHSTSFHDAVASAVQSVSQAFSALRSVLDFIQPVLEPVGRFLGDVARFAGAGGILAFVAGFKAVGPAITIAHAAETKFTSVLAAARGEQQRNVVSSEAATRALSTEAIALKQITTQGALAVETLNAVAAAQARVAATQRLALGGTNATATPIGATSQELTQIAADVATVQQSFELARPSVTSFTAAERGASTAAANTAVFHAKLSQSSTLIATESTRAATALAAESAALRTVAAEATAAASAEAALAAAESRSALAGGVSAERLAALQAALQTQQELVSLGTTGQAVTGAAGIAEVASSLQDTTQSALDAAESTAATAATFGDLGVAADSAGRLVDRAADASHKYKIRADEVIASGDQVAERQRELALAHQQGVTSATRHAGAIDVDTLALQRNAAAAKLTTSAITASDAARARGATAAGARGETAAASSLAPLAPIVGAAAVAGSSASAAKSIEGAAAASASASRAFENLINPTRRLEETTGETEQATTRLGRSFGAVGRAGSSLGRGLTTVGRGLLALIGGLPVLVTALAGLTAFGLYRIITAETQFERATNRAKNALSDFAATVATARALAIDQARAVSQIRTDRLAITTAQLAVQQARANVAQAAATTDSLAYKSAVNQLAQAQDAYRVAVAQVDEDERTLADNRKARAAANKSLLESEGLSITRLSELIVKAGIDEGNAFKRFGRSAFEGTNPFARVAGFLSFGQATGAPLGVRSAADTLDRFADSLAKIREKIREQHPDIARQIGDFEQVTRLLNRLPTDKELRVFVDTHSARSQLALLIREYQLASDGSTAFVANLERLRISIRSIDTGLAARVRLLQTFVNVTGRFPKRIVTEILLHSNFPEGLKTLRAQLEQSEALAHRLGFASGKQFADAFVLALKQLGLGASIGETLLGRAGDPAAAVRDAANAVKGQQSALRGATEAVTAAHQKVVENQQSVKDAVRSLSDANLAVADAIRSGQQQIADAIRGAQTNLRSLAGNLTDTVDSFLDAGAKTGSALKLTALEKAELAKLRAQVAAGQRGPEIERQARLLQSQLEGRASAAGDTTALDAQKASVKRRVENLAAEFDAGLISQKKFVQGIKKALADQGLSFQSIRKREGIAAALDFRGLLQGIFAQARAISATPGGRKGQLFTPEVVRPTETIQSVERNIASAQRSRDDARLAKQEAIRSLSEAQKVEQQKIAERSKALDKLNSLKEILAHDKDIATHTKNTSTHTGTTNALIRALIELMKGTAPTAAKPRGGSPVIGAIPGAGGELRPPVQEKQLSAQEKMVEHLAAIHRILRDQQTPNPNRRQSGGMIYGPSGVDTVPAMLTAGEVVLNRMQQRRLRGMLGVGHGSPESLFGMIAGHGGSSSGMFAHGGVTTGGTRDPWAWWFPLLRDWLWGQGRPGEREREKMRTGRKYGREFMWGQGGGEDLYRSHPWWMQHDRSHPQFFAQGGVATKFADLPADEKRRRILAGFSAGRMTKDQYESAFRFWHLGPTPLSGVEKALGYPTLQGRTQGHTNPLRAFGHYLLHGKKGAPPRAGLLGVGQDIRDAFNPTTKAGAANLAMMFIGPRGPIGPHGELHPEDFTGGGGVYRPEAVKGIVGRVKKSTAPGQKSVIASIGSLRVGERFKVNQPNGEMIFEVVDRGGQTGVAPVNAYARSVFPKKTFFVSSTNVERLTPVSGPRVPRDAFGRAYNIAGAPEGFKEDLGAFDIRTQLGGRYVPGGAMAASVRRAIREMGQPLRAPVRRATRRESAVAEAQKLNLSPISAVWASVIKHYPELWNSGTVSEVRGTFTSKAGQSITDFIASFPHDMVEDRANIPYLVDQTLMYLRGQKPPETASSYTSKIAEASLRARFKAPPLMTVKDIAAFARMGNAPLMDPISVYMRTIHPDLFGKNQPAEWFGYQRPEASRGHFTSWNDVDRLFGPRQALLRDLLLRSRRRRFAAGGVASSFAGGGTATKFKDLPDDEKRRRIMAGYAAGRLTRDREQAAFRFWHLGQIPAVSRTRPMTGVEKALGFRTIQSETPSNRRSVGRDIDVAAGYALFGGIKPSRIAQLLAHRGPKASPDELMVIGTLGSGKLGGPAGSVPRTGAPFRSVTDAGSIRLGRPVGHGVNAAWWAAVEGHPYVLKRGDRDGVGTELLSSVIYRLLGIPAAENRYVPSGRGGPAILSAKTPGRHIRMSHVQPREARNLSHGFIADILLNQSDLHAGNLLWLGRAGRAQPTRLDFGATLAGHEARSSALEDLRRSSFADLVGRLGPQRPGFAEMYRQARRVQDVLPRTMLDQLLDAFPFRTGTREAIRNTLYQRIPWLVEHTRLMAHGTDVSARDARFGFFDALADQDRRAAQRERVHGVGLPGRGLGTSAERFLGPVPPSLSSLLRDERGSVQLDLASFGLTRLLRARSRAAATGVSRILTPSDAVIAHLRERFARGEIDLPLFERKVAARLGPRHPLVGYPDDPARLPRMNTFEGLTRAYAVHGLIGVKQFEAALERMIAEDPTKVFGSSPFRVSRADNPARIPTFRTRDDIIKAYVKQGRIGPRQFEAALDALIARDPSLLMAPSKGIRVTDRVALGTVSLGPLAGLIGSSATNSMYPVLAALGALGAAGIAPILARLLHDLLRPKKFGAGGLVPGQGSGDTVPALLTPGEFVVSRNTLARIGAAAVQSVSPIAARTHDGGDADANARIVRYQREQQLNEARKQTQLLARINLNQRAASAPRTYPRPDSVVLSGEAKKIAEMMAGVNL